jgi:hypothetical protein
LDELRIVRPPLLSTAFGMDVADVLREDLQNEDLTLVPDYPFSKW